MLLEDAIGAAPRHYRTPLAEAQLDEPVESLAELKARLGEMRDALGTSATELWSALLMRDERTAADVLAALQAHQPMQLSHWRSPNVEADESAGIPGEHLLHAAAFAGNRAVLELLLRAAVEEAALCEREISTKSVGGVERSAERGRLERRKTGEPVAAAFASSGRMLLVERGDDDPTGVRRKLVNRRGAKTKSTPLHAAAAAGHAAVISMLIEAGARRGRLPLASQPGVARPRSLARPCAARRAESPRSPSLAPSPHALPRALSRTGAVVDAQSITLRTPLHMACARGWTDAALALVTAGVWPARARAARRRAPARASAPPRLSLIASAPALVPALPISCAYACACRLPALRLFLALSLRAALAGADPYRNAPGLETPIALLRKWAGSDPKGEAAVRAIALVWEQNGGADAAGGGDDDTEEDDDDDVDNDDDDGSAKGKDKRRAESDDYKKLKAKEAKAKASKAAGGLGQRDLLDGDLVDLDNLYGHRDDNLRRRRDNGDYTSDSGSEDSYGQDNYDSEEAE
jgi:ankyrin repeat protein